MYKIHVKLANRSFLVSGNRAMPLRFTGNCASEKWCKCLKLVIERKVGIESLEIVNGLRAQPHHVVGGGFVFLSLSQISFQLYCKSFAIAAWKMSARAMDPKTNAPLVGCCFMQLASYNFIFPRSPNERTQAVPECSSILKGHKLIEKLSSTFRIFAVRHRKPGRVVG